MDISGSMSNSSNSLNMRPLFAGYPFQGIHNLKKKKKIKIKFFSIKVK